MEQSKEEYKRGWLGLSEAAELSDCSRDTIRRAAQREEIKAEMGPGARGPQWWIESSSLHAWIEARGAVEQSTASSSSRAQHSVPSSARQSDAELSTAKNSCRAEHGKRSSAQHENAELSTASYVFEASEAAQEHVPKEVHQAVISDLVEELRRVDRQVIALQLQLNQERKLLSENAESLIEKEAAVREAQAQKEEEAKQVEEVRRQAEEAVRQAKAETTAIAEQLKEARTEIATWESRRKQPFWKRLFRGA